MPGTVLRLLVAAGDTVRARQPLVVLEAMKMEQVVTAPFDGDVRSVDVRAGEQVASGTVLVTLETA
jgi:biotin carboxyl carrier protein